MAGRTLYDKLFDAHVVHENDDGSALLYIDRHLLHEVTSPQAFEGLRLAGRRPWRIDANLAVSDHNVPTTGREAGIEDPISRLQVETLDANCDEHGIVQFKLDDPRPGIGLRAASNPAVRCGSRNPSRPTGWRRWGRWPR